MIHHSPLPDVEIPDLPLTEYVLAGGAGRPDKPALIDGASGRVMTYGALYKQIRRLEVIDAIPKWAAGKILRGRSAIPPGPDPPSPRPPSPICSAPL